MHAPKTVELYARSLDMFTRFLREREGDRARLHVGLLSKTVTGEFYEWLKSNGRHGRVPGLNTRKKRVQHVEEAWSWAFEEEDFGDFVPRVRHLDMPNAPGTPTLAPTWAEMDACIGALKLEWLRRLVIVLRFTGLRVSQGMGLLWSDFDLDGAILTFRGELGKTKSEKKGRIIPISPLLTAELAGWGPREGWLIQSNREGKHSRVARQRDVRRAWLRAGVRSEVWDATAGRKGQSFHAFRKGLVTGLKRLGADTDAVEHLVGHSMGLRGIYTDPQALGMREAVALIPPIGSQPEAVRSLDRARSVAR